MSYKQSILLAKFHKLKNRHELLMTHSNDIFLNSEKIKEYREKLNPNLILEHKNEKISEQIKLFEKAYTKEELLIMRNNIQDLIVDNFRSLIFIPIASAYNQYYNRIWVNPLCNTQNIDNKKILNHEMHHMATNLGRIENYIIGGFEQHRIENQIAHIGKGLNEGYTEYLCKNNLENEKNYYKKNVDLIPLIELFYNNKLELRKSYFNADLPSVIKKFSEITDRDSAIKLIKDIDKLLFYDSNKTWFDKSEKLEIDIRIKLYNLYKKLSGYSNKEELFFDNSMLEKIYRKKLNKKFN